jgi:hypothetical protein
MDLHAKQLHFLEKAMKLMEKYSMESLQLPDGTILKKTLHIQAMQPKVQQRPQPINEPEVDIRFAAVMPKQKNDFSRFRASNVLASRDGDSSNG